MADLEALFDELDDLTARAIPGFVLAAREAAAGRR
jgi:hypothetical protein